MRLCVGVSCEEWGCHSTSQSDAVPHMYSEIYPPSNEEYSTEEQWQFLYPPYGIWFGYYAIYYNFRLFSFRTRPTGMVNVTDTSYK